jgi:hypothetical protein
MYTKSGTGLSPFSQYEDLCRIQVPGEGAANNESDGQRQSFCKLILLPGVPFDICRPFQHCSLMEIEEECLAKKQVSAQTKQNKLEILHHSSLVTRPVIKAGEIQALVIHMDIINRALC